MKTHFTILIFLSIKAFGQAKMGTNSISSKENKELAKALFNRVNEHRNTLKLGSFLWTEHWYNSSLNANKILEEKNAWGHTSISDMPKNFVCELIVGMTYLNDNIPDNKTIVDSCLNQWRHSYHHNWRLELPLMTEKQKEIRKPRLFGEKEITYSTDLAKYGAISCIISNYGYYSIVKFIFQMGQEEYIIMPEK